MLTTKKSKVLIFSLIVIITLGSFVVHFLGILLAFKSNWLYIVLMSLLGLFITSIIASLFHELGHLIFGLFSGLKLVELKIAFISLKFDKKFTISFVKPKEFGETVFMPKNTTNYSFKLRMATLGGLVFSLIYLLFGMTIVFISSNLQLVLLFGVSYHLSFYILLVNAIPFSGSSDGTLLYSYYFKGGLSCELIDNVLSANAEILLGTMPKDVNSYYLTDFAVSYDYYLVMLKYYRYLAFLWRDEESAFKELFQISDISKLPDELYEPIYKELFFASVIRGDSSFIKNNEEIIIGYLENNSSPQDYRIHASYRLYTGENEWAKLIIESGLKALENEVQTGFVKYEKEFLLILKSNI